MFVLYNLSLVWSKVDYLADAGALAQNRLLNELAFAFTRQGVHVENSPGYHKIMLGRVKELIQFNELGDTKLSQKAIELTENLEKFLSAITLPDGYLPMIGDTRGNDKGIYSEYGSKIEMFDYSESGYCIVRGFSNNQKPYHLVFKCGHFTNYHRHDDDLSVHLYFNDELVFGDAGLFSYNEKDPKRLFVRSARGHCTFYPVNEKPARNLRALTKSPECFLDKKNKKMVGITHCYGSEITLKRTVIFKEIAIGKLLIIDEVLHLPPSANNIPCSINYFFPAEPNKIIIDNQKVEIELRNNYIAIIHSEGKSDFFSEWNEDTFDGALVSTSFNSFTRACRLKLEVNFYIGQRYTSIINVSDNDLKAL